MLSFQEANLAELSIHHLGNKAENEYMVLAEKSTMIEDELLGSLLKQFFLNNFQKSSEVFRLYTPEVDLKQNKVYQLVDAYFQQQENFHAMSVELAKYLYETDNHPKSKSGECYVVYFENLQIEGELHDAIGIFKSENKETYLKVNPIQGSFTVGYEKEGISLQKLDKACVIFNCDREEGYKIMAIEQTKPAGNNVWKDDFLQLKIRKDNYTQTQAIMGVYKNFVSEKLDDEFEVERTDKIDLLNRSMKYFKEKDNFDIDEFSQEVIANEEGIALFKSYKENYEQEMDNPIADNFVIADAAVKKQAKDYKSILKLDKNFHVYIHGSKDLISKEYDEEKGMNCYKLYFKEEN